MRKFCVKYILFFLLLFFVFSLQQTKAKEDTTAYFFYGKGCPHCTQEEQFLKALKQQHPGLEIKIFEIYHHKANALFLEKVAKELDTEVSGVPFLVIGDEVIIGYADGITSNKIERQTSECLEQACPDSVAPLLEEATAAKTDDNSEEKKQNDKKNTEEHKNSEEKQTVKLPFLGETDIYKFSLPVLTVIMGGLDGFNPCAMWTLLFLISLLLGMKNRRRMWTLGVTFIVASAAVYFLFMSAWLNLMLFLGLIIWVRWGIGALALFGGGYSIKEFFTNKGGGCKVTGTEKRQKVFEKLKAVTYQKSLWLALGGIIVLAFMVNLVELICSAGLPAIYTQILAINDLATWQYYLYIFLYIFFFMLDDLFVFFVAMITLEMTGVTTKYARYSRLIGGILMLIIGILLILKPEWLMFG